MVGIKKKSVLLPIVVLQEDVDFYSSFVEMNLNDLFEKFCLPIKRQQTRSTRDTSLQTYKNEISDGL